MRLVKSPVFQSNLLQSLHGPLLSPGGFDPLVKHGKLDIFKGRHTGKKVKTLKDKTNSVFANIRQPVDLEGTNINTVKHVTSVTGIIKASYYIEKGRFP